MNGVMIESTPSETIPKFEASSCSGGSYYPSMYTSPELQLQAAYPSHLHTMLPSHQHQTSAAASYGLMSYSPTSPYNPMAMHAMPGLPSVHISSSLQQLSYPSALPTTHGFPISTSVIEPSPMSVADYLTPMKRPPSSMSDPDIGSIPRPPAKRAAQICLKCHQPRKGHVCPFKTRTPPKTYREFPVGQGDKVITCCPNCGIPLYAGSKYCHKCGSVNAVSGQTALSLFTTQRVPKLSPEEAQQLAALHPPLPCYTVCLFGTLTLALRARVSSHRAFGPV
eukprot:sb/3467911/